MSRKVLLSFLGTGRLQKEGKEERKYATAAYHLGEENLGKYPFVAAALKKHYQADTLLLVGTLHSMWEEVYRWFTEDSGNNPDDDTYFRIAETCENASSKSPLVFPDAAAIEQSLGNDSKVVLIKYGLNEEEVMENINIVLGLEQYLRQDDELIVDITHSFRSLPMFVMNLLIYLQNVSKKQVKISHIHYGMLDMINELGYAPIIEMKRMLDVNNWITGAYSFSEFGNAYKIAKLMENEDLSVANLLKRFSNLMNLNHLHGIQSLSQELTSLKNKEYQTLLPQQIITPITEDFIKQFNATRNTHASFQVRVARWQFEHKKYAQALLSLNESIITYVCEENGMRWDDYDCRENAKEALRSRNDGDIYCRQEMKNTYRKLKPLRDLTAHSIETDKSISNIIKTLRESIEIIESIIL